MLRLEDQYLICTTSLHEALYAAYRQQVGIYHHLQNALVRIRDEFYQEIIKSCSDKIVSFSSVEIKFKEVIYSIKDNIWVVSNL